jgi:hypothetical protein
MFFEQDRNQLRQQYYQAWHKHNHRQALEPLEKMLVDVITMHPEYHSLLKEQDKGLDRDYLPEVGETNPFLHMGMHIALHEQVGTDRPAGIRDIARQLLLKYEDSHEAEHKMMECLGEMIWQSQRNNTLPDEQAYLLCLQGLI